MSSYIHSRIIQHCAPTALHIRNRTNSTSTARYFLRDSKSLDYITSKSTTETTSTAKRPSPASLPRPRPPTGTDGIPPRARRCLRIVSLTLASSPTLSLEQRVVKRGVHTPEAPRSRESTSSGTANKRRAEGIVRPQTWRVKVVAADAERRVGLLGDAERRVNLVLIFEAGGREVGDWAGTGRSGEGVVDGVGMAWLRAGVREGVGWGVGALRAGGFGLRGGLDVAFCLEGGDELLDDVDF